MGIIASFAQPLEDQEPLAVTTVALAGSGSYDSGFKSVESYRLLVGMVLAIIDTIGTITFTAGGGGLDDCAIVGPYTSYTERDYQVDIDTIGAVDTFRWSHDGGATWEAALVAITGLAQTLEYGVTVTFGAVTGHAVGDNWAFTATRTVGTVDVIQSQDGTNEDSKSFSSTIYSNDPDNAAFEVAAIGPYAKLKFTNGARAASTFRASLNGKVS